MDRLLELRDEIDEIDRQIVDLFEKTHGCQLTGGGI